MVLISFTAQSNVDRLNKHTDTPAISTQQYNPLRDSNRVNLTAATIQCPNAPVCYTKLRYCNGYVHCIYRLGMYGILKMLPVQVVITFLELESILKIAVLLILS